MAEIEKERQEYEANLAVMQGQAAAQ